MSELSAEERLEDLPRPGAPARITGAACLAISDGLRRPAGFRETYQPLDRPRNR